MEATGTELAGSLPVEKLAIYILLMMNIQKLWIILRHLEKGDNWLCLTQMI
jgi:hypothetical protein